MSKQKTALIEAEQEGQIILVKPGPNSRDEAKSNIRAFSKERRALPADPCDDSRKPVPPMPPLPSCYGWLKIDNTQLPTLTIGLSKDHPSIGYSIAIVYDYIGETPRDENGDPIIDETLVNRFLTYLHTVGLGIQFNCRNWRQSRLVDQNDIYLPSNHAWSRASTHHEFSMLNWKDPYEDPNHPINAYQRGKPKKRQIVRSRGNPSR